MSVRNCDRIFHRLGRFSVAGMVIEGVKIFTFIVESSAALVLCSHTTSRTAQYSLCFTLKVN